MDWSLFCVAVIFPSSGSDCKSQLFPEFESLDTSLSVLDDEIFVLSLFEDSGIGESLSFSGLDGLGVEEESKYLRINSIPSTLCSSVIDTGCPCSDMYVEEFL